MAVLYISTFGDRLLKEPLKGYPVSLCCFLSTRLLIDNVKSSLKAWMEVF